MEKLESREFIEGNERCIVWLHGYGANMDDLAPLKDYVQVKADHIFLNGLNRIPISFFMDGRAWFPLDLEKMQSAGNQGTSAELFRKHLPDGYNEAYEIVKSYLDSIKDKYKSIIIAGFSQGSMLASRLALSCDYIKAAILLSSIYFDEKGWDFATKLTNQKLSIFQSHGTQDAVLPVYSARDLKDLLQGQNFDHEYIEFQGGHEIPPTVIDALNGFLNSRSEKL